MPTPTSSEQQRQHEYETLCSAEKRLCDEFVRTRDSGRVSVDVIAEHYKPFNAAIRARADFKRRFPHVKEPTQTAAPTSSLNPANVCASTPWMPLKGI